jgi:hypothetical protein
MNRATGVRADLGPFYFMAEARPPEAVQVECGVAIVFVERCPTGYRGWCTARPLGLARALRYARSHKIPSRDRRLSSLLRPGSPFLPGRSGRNPFPLGVCQNRANQG